MVLSKSRVKPSSRKYKPLNLDKLKERHFAGEIFTFTNSAIIDHLEELVQKLPEFHFNVAAE